MKIFYNKYSYNHGADNLCLFVSCFKFSFCHYSHYPDDDGCHGTYYRWLIRLFCARMNAFVRKRGQSLSIAQRCCRCKGMPWRNQITFLALSRAQCTLINHLIKQPWMIVEKYLNIASSLCSAINHIWDHGTFIRW